jgi:uncharacterized membrane protein YfcA
MISFVLTFAAGIISGSAMGLIGIGGGALLMPLLMFAGLSLPQSVAIVLFTQVVPQTLPGLLLYWRSGYFLWQEALVVTIGSFIGVTFGAFLASRDILTEKTLYKLMSITFLGLSAGIWMKYCI